MRIQRIKFIQNTSLRGYITSFAKEKLILQKKFGKKLKIGFFALKIKCSKIILEKFSFL
jgi:hypothetical protein